MGRILATLLLPLGVWAGPSTAAPLAGTAAPARLLRAVASGPPDFKAANRAQARLRAEAAASAAVGRRLMALARAIELAPGRTLGDAMSDAAVRGRVERVVGGFKVVSTRYFSDQGVEIEAEVPVRAVVDAVASVPSPEVAAAGAEQAAGHTGILVDARSFGLGKRAIARLVDESGRPVYALAGTSSPAGSEEYVSSLEAASASQRVGGRPMLLKATALKGADLVLSAEDLRRMSAADQRLLSEGRVAILANL